MGWWKGKSRSKRYRIPNIKTLLRHRRVRPPHSQPHEQPQERPETGHAHNTRRPKPTSPPPNSQPQKRTRTEKHGTDTEHSPHTRYHTTLQPIRLSNARKPRQPGSRARPSGARPPKAERAHASPPAGACAKDVRSKAGTEETKKSRYNSSMGCVTGLWSWVRETASTETWRARRSISHA